MICGIDEAGRGPLAGPVYAAAVMLPPDFPRDALADSKALSPKKREEAEALLREKALAYGLGSASAAEIDRMNILQASLLAMRRAFLAMLESSGSLLPREIVIDGLYAPPLPPPYQALCRPLVRADSSVPEVMAASILAKTARDACMRRLAEVYPGYGYERHKGYPTKAHYAALARLGPSPVHRLTFKGVSSP